MKKKSITCCLCGKEIKGGMYNTPSGVYCPDCWERKPKQEKKKEEMIALSRLATLGKVFKI
ncbi:hypothetical protein AB9N12_18595 [Bacteroides sp. AN502(2024)]|uniref:hypothetical protein n=1 Tax=Bacteroides sp. AN502(2024) TaxID=3160599 RepID=UPI003518E82F